MIRRAILAAIAWAGIACAVAAGVPPAASLNFPSLTGRVVDGAGLLSAAQAAALTDSLAALEQKTTDQLVVVTLNTLQGTTIEDYGYQLGRHWGIGQKGKDSGALLIVAAKDHAVRIEVGYGLEGVLTDAATKTIIESDILPRFKAGDFPGGIAAGVADIETLLGGDAAVSPDAGPAPRPAGSSAWPAIGLGLAAVVLLIFCGFTGGFICRSIFQVFFLMMLSGRGSSSGGGQSSPSFSGGGGSFGGGGSSGSW